MGSMHFIIKCMWIKNVKQWQYFTRKKNYAMNKKIKYILTFIFSALLIYLYLLMNSMTSFIHLVFTIILVLLILSIYYILGLYGNNKTKNQAILVFYAIGIISLVMGILYFVM